jgi:hypothetical protein
MADKSVIQTTANAHKAAGEDIIAVQRQMSVVTGCIPATTENIDTYCKGYADGWAMATYHLLHGGNCKFEVDHV